MRRVAAGFASELVGDTQIKSAPPPIFLVASDAFAPPTPHVGLFQQFKHFTIGRIEASVAVGAAVKCGFAETSAHAAKAFLAAPFFQAAGRRLEADDFPLCAFVIDDVVRAKLAQGEEARAGNKLAIVAWNPSTHGQRWEIIARQKSFTGEIPIWVKITFLAVGGYLPEQIELAQRLLLPPSCRFLIVTLACASKRNLRLGKLADGGAEQFTPAVKGAVEIRRVLRQ